MQQQPPPQVPDDWQNQQQQQNDETPLTGWYPSEEYVSNTWNPQQPPQQDMNPLQFPPHPSDVIYPQNFGEMDNSEFRRISGVPSSLGDQASASPEGEGGGSDTSDLSRFASMNGPSSSSSAGDLSRMMSEGSQSLPQRPNTSFSGPSGIPSSEHIAPSGTSLRRGMACKFCRRRKLRCSGERPACSSCVKYKQECEYQPPAKISKVQALESRVAELSDYITQGTVPNLSSAFSSQPLAYDENGLPQPIYGDSYPNDPQAQYQYLNYTLPVSGDNSNPSTFTPNVNMNGQPYPPYVPTPPQTAFQTNFPQPNQYAMYPTYGENAQYVTAPSDSSPATASLQTPHQFQQGFRAVSSSSPIPANSFDQNVTDEAINPNPNYTYPSDTQRATQSVPQLVPSQSQTHPQNQYPPNSSFAVAQPLVQRSSLNSESSTSSNTHNALTPNGSAGISTPSSSSVHAPPGSQSMYAELANLRYTTDIAESDPVDKLTERLGEFLFSPINDSVKEGTDENSDVNAPGLGNKKRRTAKAQSGQWSNGASQRSDGPERTSLFRSRIESDSLRDEHRKKLLDTFLGHCRLFFEMSIPRFWYRMTFHDRRRPSLALLNAMYLWATRMTASPNLVPMEAHFFAEACRHLDSAGPNSDRLIDAVKAAMLLCAYSYTNGRHHEGWLIAGLAVRLVTSTGIHQIPSLTFRPTQADNPFLRNRVHLLPPPEDAVELAERVHAFWCVYSIEKCGAFATGFPSSLRDDDIATPFGRPLDEIASQSVTLQDDVTVRDLFKGTAHPHPDGDSPYIRWVKAVAILERASKLAFLTPTDDSEYSQAWHSYATSLSNGSPPPNPPPGWLNQPKYRNSKDYDECSRALKQYIESLGIDGVSPIERRQQALQEGSIEPVIRSHTILLHHQVYASEMLMNDINSLDTENDIAVAAGRKSADLVKGLPPIPPQEVDAQVILVWCMIIKLLIKELRRCTKIGDYSASRSIEDDIDVLIKEMNRIGHTMHIARVQSKAMDDFKKAALAV
ncbi:hypothetical protein I302_100241 [Kwoniella bestiolae CBS 10118]|uniref:Zn(2)-C6 fungal-type domain-containing protein n=1 Tax=Kwoniella bestiolae CBS 10118 TaxID=1296100 RepID=A0A1B9G4L8_9TREE|nr:hypothetical protein I302_03615 [Kwoniella bestiolae CBS 10118]OCF25938.1 hypothetical protein I302_03615 [Kwoniella bestiolae CBS 10118]